MADTRKDWTSGAQQITDTWNKDNGSSVRNQITEAYDKMKILIKSIEMQQINVDKCAEIIERDFSEEDIACAIERAENETDELRYKTQDLVNDSVGYLYDMRDIIDQIADAWRSVQNEIEDAIPLIQNYLQYIGETRNAVSSLNYETGGSVDVSSAGATTPSMPSSGIHRVNEGIIKKPENNNTDTGKNYYVEGYDDRGYKVHAQDLTLSEAQEYMNLINIKGGKVSVNHYDTGSYTGEWNSDDGRLAVLHQKELVLNKDDTSNFLDGINTIRDMSALNGSISEDITRSVANMILELGKVKGGN